MFRKSISLTIIIAFVCTLITPVPKANASTLLSTSARGLLGLPEPGAMVNLSHAYNSAMIKGITIHKDNPFLFDFIVDVGQDKLQGEALKKEGEKLIKYFLANLAIPEENLWVNLSPYEKDRTIPKALGQTEMGRDLLAQDYLLKQITASLIYPEQGLGKEFWNRVYAKAGNVKIPVNTFNKVWIMADKAEIFERNQTAFVVGCHLKVMLEEDYLAENRGQRPIFQKDNPNSKNRALSPILRELILPELEREVNNGKNFANLRQIFNSIILSSWYKNNLKEALLTQVFANKEKIKGIDLNDPTVKDQIYERYLQAYKKGVFNFIKEEDRNGQTIPRKYFSGGMRIGVTPANLAMSSDLQSLRAAFNSTSSLVGFITQVRPAGTDSNAAMIGIVLIPRTDPVSNVKRWAGIAGLLLRQEYHPQHPREAITINPETQVIDVKGAKDLFSFDGAVGLIEEIVHPQQERLFIGWAGYWSPDINDKKVNRMVIYHETNGKRAYLLEALARVVPSIWEFGREKAFNREGYYWTVNKGYYKELMQWLESLRDNVKEGKSDVPDFPADAAMRVDFHVSPLWDPLGQIRILEAIQRNLEAGTRRDTDYYWQPIIDAPSSNVVGAGALNDIRGYINSVVGGKYAISGGSKGAIIFSHLPNKDELNKFSEKINEELHRLYTSTQVNADNRTRDFQVSPLQDPLGQRRILEEVQRNLVGNPRYVPGDRRRPAIISSPSTNLVGASNINEIQEFFKGLTANNNSYAFSQDENGSIIFNYGTLADLDAFSKNVADKLGQLIGKDDAAMSPGGIDLKTSQVDWNLRKEGPGVEIKVDPAMLERIRRDGIEGLNVQILRMIPMSMEGIWPLLGLQPPARREEQMAKV